MEIILKENVANVGFKDEVVTVKPGYGRNYLLKTGKALRFNKENLNYVSKKKDELNKKNVELKNKLKDIAQLVNKKTFLFNKESKENGELYGSLSVSDIVSFLNENEISIQKKSVKLGNKIKTIGEYSVNIDLHPEVNCSLNIEILSPKTSS